MIGADLMYIKSIEKAYGKKARPSVELAEKVQKKNMTFIKQWSFKVRR